MTPSFEIPRERWPEFLKMVNQHVLDNPVTVELAHQELLDQEVGTLLPLRNIDFETKGSERGHVILTVGTDREELTHEIKTPTRLFVGTREMSAIEWLAIEDAEGGKTMIHFEHLLALPHESSEEGTLGV